MIEQGSGLPRCLQYSVLTPTAAEVRRESHRRDMARPFAFALGTDAGLETRDSKCLRQKGKNPTNNHTTH